MSQILLEFLFGLVGAFALMLLGYAQAQSGFISIDCGLEQNSYTESTTTITYIPDTSYIDTGESKTIASQYIGQFPQQFQSVRIFPEGTRNCYKIDNIKRGQKYLIRASFLYGNYDGENSAPEFELHLGANLWDSVNFTGVAFITVKELIHIPMRSYIHVCMVDIKKGVPFISTIELRTLPDEIYQTGNGSLAVFARYDTGQRATNNVYRYPTDVCDRVWFPYFQPDWGEISTLFADDPSQGDDPAQGDNQLPPAVMTAYQLPSAVMSTAATPKDTSSKYLNFAWIPPLVGKDTSYYFYMHFAEVQEISTGRSRQLTITMNGEPIAKPFDPPYLSATTINTTVATEGGRYNFSVSTLGTTYLPILNAIEIFMAKEFLVLETNLQDVEAIAKLKSTYKITKNWQGDPCNPPVYLWEGVKCSYSDNDPPRIISLDLSSNGLTGEIAASIADLKMIETLDLSNNSLSGKIPEYLSQLSKLKALKLDKNELTGSVPAELMAKGNLSMSLCRNLNLSGQVPCEKKKNKYIIPIVASIIVILLVSSIATAILWNSRRFRAALKYLRLGEEHIVFLSFRGKDVRKGFANNLYEALEKTGIRTFFDDKKLRAGAVIAQELVGAIEKSKISVIIISENYATSHWCLDELVKILDCKKSRNQCVVPIFYKVEPSDVRHQTGTFSLTRWEDKKDKIVVWQKALQEVGDLAGVAFKEERNESDLIEDIVQRVSKAYKQKKNEARNSRSF